MICRSKKIIEGNQTLKWDLRELFRILVWKYKRGKALSFRVGVNLVHGIDYVNAWNDRLFGWNEGHDQNFPYLYGINVGFHPKWRNEGHDQNFPYLYGINDGFHPKWRNDGHDQNFPYLYGTNDGFHPNWRTYSSEMTDTSIISHVTHNTYPKFSTSPRQKP